MTPRTLQTSALLLVGTLSGIAQAGDTPAWPCLNPPTLSPGVPGDTVLSNQPALNCFAWQQFIALNWPASTARPPADFGTPGDLKPVVFETYKDVAELMNPKGTAPPPWSAPAAGAKAADIRPRLLRRTSKFQLDFTSDDIAQAYPFNSNFAWLADRDGNLVWYEILVNEPEYDYFVDNRYYNADIQAAAPHQGKKLDLPKGDLSGATGAMELKAAWLTVTDPDNPRWQRYKLAPAKICTGRGEEHACRDATVALVGLHIIHKTVSQPSWIWATFEHVDNAPDQSAVDAGAVDRDYTFYSASCTPREIPAGCKKRDRSLEETSCAPNTVPAYALDLSGGGAGEACPPYPIQVTRLFATPDTDENPLVQTNAAAQTMIRAANPHSVYQYYKLVNVLWNDSPVDENAGKKPPLAPLSDTAFRPNPNAFPVANTTMETYFQGHTCIFCHSTATVAASVEYPDQKFASDYSFVFQMAGPKPPKPASE